MNSLISVIMITYFVKKKFLIYGNFSVVEVSREAILLTEFVSKTC